MEILCLSWRQIDLRQIEPFVRKKSREDVHRLLLNDPTKNDLNKVYLVNIWDKHILKLLAKQAFFSLVTRRLSQARGERDTRKVPPKEETVTLFFPDLALRFRLSRFMLGPV